MLNAKVLGVGFGGNKATLQIIKDGVINTTQALLINSTKKDIPVEFEDISAVYANSYGGAAKERSSGKELCLDALRNDTEFQNKIDNIVEPDTEVVIITTSTEGGTGSSGSIIIAKYIYSVIRKRYPKLKIMMFPFTGFEDDVRGLQNTLEFFQELDPNYTVQAISNKKFLDDGLTRTQSEQKANEVFSEKVAIALGKNIDYTDAKHNIDESDLLKLSTTPGFMFTTKVRFGKLKNTENFNKLLTEAIDNDKSLDIPRQSISRFGIITNISEKNEEFIDYKFPVIRAKLGTYFDIFIHDNKYDGGEEYIEFICAGLEMPIDEIKKVYEQYKAESQNVSKDRDTFFDFMNDLRGDFNDSMFDIGANKKSEIKPTNIELDKNSFFDEFEIKSVDNKEDRKESIKKNF